MYLDRPFPEFFGAQLNDQPGGELQWKVVADLRGKMEPPTSEMIRFSVRENNWMDGLARAMQEALARLCGQNVNKTQEFPLHPLRPTRLDGRADGYVTSP